MKTTLLNYTVEQKSGFRKTHARSQAMAGQVGDGDARRPSGGRSRDLRWKLIRETERFLSDPQSRPWELATTARAMVNGQQS